MISRGCRRVAGGIQPKMPATKGIPRVRKTAAQSKAAADPGAFLVDIESAAAAAPLEPPFPPIELPITPPYLPMEAKSAKELPEGGEWLFEPKWDGFRGLIFRRGKQVLIQSKAGQPLGRYFPELVQAFQEFPADKFVLDGEIVIFDREHLDFNALLQRIHPAEKRIRQLSVETPSSFLAFDLLVVNGRSLVEFPLRQRRSELEEFCATGGGAIRLSPITASRDQALGWLSALASTGLDGVMAKQAGAIYYTGQRKGMLKIKKVRTVDCVVGGFRYASQGEEIGSLLLGLFNREGRLDHIGFSSSFTAEFRRTLKPLLLPLRGGPGFTGKAPGGPSRWSSERSGDWHPLRTELVCEVTYDHFAGGRFRHGAQFLRWRPDKPPQNCTIDQVVPSQET